MGKKIHFFNLFWSHIQKDFFEITNRTKLDYFKKFRYTRRPHTAKIHTLPKKPCSRRSIVKLYTLFKTHDPEK